MDATAWDQRYAAEPLVWSAEPNQFVAEHLAPLTAGRALDLACGEGRNAIWLARRGWSVTAVDFSSVAIDKGRARAAVMEAQEELAGQIKWQVGDATTFEGSDYDLAMLAYLQLPPREREAALRCAWLAVSVGGHLFVVGHDSSNLTEGTGGPSDPLVLYTAEDVLADLAGARFKTLHAGRVARVVPAGDQHGGEPDRTAWDVLVHLVKTG